MMRAIDDDRGFTLVELLVVMVVMAIVAGATVSVVVTTGRAQAFTSQLRTVMDDARVSLDRIRTELRSARLVHEDVSSASAVSFWVDQDQNSFVDGGETICYRSELVSGETDRWRLVRYVDLVGTCDADDSSTFGGGQILAQTLRSSTASAPAIFQYLPDPPGLDPTDDDNVQVMNVALIFDVKNSTRGPDELDVAGTIRLRNVARTDGT